MSAIKFMDQEAPDPVWAGAQNSELLIALDEESLKITLEKCQFEKKIKTEWPGHKVT